MNDPNIIWKDGQAPDYTLEDLDFFKGKTHNHHESSREFFIENLLKTWEMEHYHKVDCS